jgi:hypothetical protein
VLFRSVQFAVGGVQALQRNESAAIRVDAGSHFDCPFVFDMTDAILAVGGILPGGVEARTEPSQDWPCQLDGR